MKATIREAVSFEERDPVRVYSAGISGALAGQRRETLMRPLFIEELKKVQGGGKPDRPFPPATTLACCEEGPGGCCAQV